MKKWKPLNIQAVHLKTRVLLTKKSNIDFKQEIHVIIQSRLFSPRLLRIWKLKHIKQ